MLQLACALLFITIARGSAVPQYPPGEKIVGGVDTTVEEIPYQVALEWLGEQFCGGSIITSRHILTAAHCTYLLNFNDTAVRVGATRQESNGTVIQALNFKHHPNFTFWGLADLDYDVSIIELTEEIKFSKTSQIISLTDTEPAPGTYVTASGWGRTMAGGNSSEILQSTKMVVVAREECSKIYGNQLTEHMFCAGDVRGTCKGDSGGPITKEVASGERLLAGIVSWGKNGCAEADYPGVYTNVAHPDIMNFILQTIKT